MSKMYTPRLSIDISQSQHDKLVNLVPWGVKNVLFRAIVDDVIELIDEHGPIVIAAILEKRLRIKNLQTFKDLPKKRRGTKNGNT
jgi:hypothetical protein